MNKIQILRHLFDPSLITSHFVAYIGFPKVIQQESSNFFVYFADIYVNSVSLGGYIRF